MENIQLDTAINEVLVSQGAESLTVEWSTGDHHVVHFHHKHTCRQSRWKDIAKELHGPNLILCVDHNSLVVKHRDAFTPPEFEHDTSLRARDQEVRTLAKAGLQDVWVDIHCPTLTDIKDKEASCPTGFTYGYPREGE